MRLLSWPCRLPMRINSPKLPGWCDCPQPPTACSRKEEAQLRSATKDVCTTCTACNSILWYIKYDMILCGNIENIAYLCWRWFTMIYRDPKVADEWLMIRQGSALRIPRCWSDSFSKSDLRPRLFCKLLDRPLGVAVQTRRCELGACQGQDQDGTGSSSSFHLLRYSKRTTTTN